MDLCRSLCRCCHPVGATTVLHRRGKVVSLCKGLCHCGRQWDGDAYRMQMGVDGDGMNETVSALCMSERL